MENILDFIENNINEVGKFIDNLEIRSSTNNVASIYNTKVLLGQIIMSLQEYKEQHKENKNNDESIPVRND